MRSEQVISSITAGAAAIAILLLASSLVAAQENPFVPDGHAKGDGTIKMAQGMMGPGMMGGMRRNMMQQMMGGTLPPGIDPALLPEPHSAGAGLLRYYCTQCHNLPGPSMHTDGEWPQVLGRMNMRMQMMGGMMGVMAPDDAELEILLTYLQKHAQKPIDAAEYPDLNTWAGQAFRATCMQCHALPDPRQHTAQEWPAVVGRMRGHEAAMGRIVPDETATEEIIGFLRKHGRTQE